MIIIILRQKYIDDIIINEQGWSWGWGRGISIMQSQNPQN